MITTTLNGVRLTILTKAEAKTHHIPSDELLSIDKSEFLYGLRTKGDYTKAAGVYDNVDHAIDQRWLDGQPTSKHQELTRWGVWDYAYNTIFGEYLDIRTLVPHIVGAVRAMG